MQCPASYHLPGCATHTNTAGHTCFCAGVRLGQHWLWAECWPIFLFVVQQKRFNVNAVVHNPRTIDNPCTSYWGSRPPPGSSLANGHQNSWGGSSNCRTRTWQRGLSADTVFLSCDIIRRPYGACPTYATGLFNVVSR